MSQINVDSIANKNEDGPVYFPYGMRGDATNLIYEPKVLYFDPVPLSTGISTTTNITITFDQQIQFSGVGTIYIREGSPTGTVIENFTCGVDPGATIAGETLVINPTQQLGGINTTNYVILPPVGIANTFGAMYKGTSAYFFQTLKPSDLFSASGGNSVFTIASPTSPTGYHKYHVFTATGILTTTAPSFDAVDLYSILVAGGGAGNFSGGGAGGVFKNTGPELALSVGTYTVTIGAGGATSPAYFLSPTVTPDFGNGENSTISNPTTTISSYGGGRGSLNDGPSPSSSAIAGNPGGSGGGSHATPAAQLGGTGIPGQGNSGGQGYSPNIHSRSGSGGGGAGGAGSSGNNFPTSPTTNTYTITGGSGGAGTPVPQFTSSIIGGRVPSIPTATITEIGTSGLYGGGGGGGTPMDSPTWPLTFTGGVGGVGGGGNGYLLAPPVTRPNESGFTNTGGGGGGGAHVLPASWIPGASGGSGVFMIRYAVPAP